MLGFLMTINLKNGDDQICSHLFGLIEIERGAVQDTGLALIPRPKQSPGLAGRLALPQNPAVPPSAAKGTATNGFRMGFPMYVWIHSFS